MEVDMSVTESELAEACSGPEQRLAEMHELNPSVEVGGVRCAYRVLRLVARRIHAS